MVEYIDNSVIAQMSVPDMRSCVQYALTYPCRVDAVIDELDLFSVGELHFAKPDTDTFSLLSCAVKAINLGGALPAALNAADEVAVDAFLKGKLSFCGISEKTERLIDDMLGASKLSSLEEIIAVDSEARQRMKQLING
jgi:1-deoxy-D-xylulose-5-phosphate reductoisomerase